MIPLGNLVTSLEKGGGWCFPKLAGRALRELLDLWGINPRVKVVVDTTSGHYGQGCNAYATHGYVIQFPFPIRKVGEVEDRILNNPKPYMEVGWFNMRNNTLVLFHIQ